MLLVVPGLIVNLGLGARGFDALGLAPLTSLGVLAIGTLMVPAVVGRWSIAAVAVSLAIVTVIAVLGRIGIAWWTGRGVPDRPGPSVPLAWRVLLGYRPSGRWWVPRRRTTWWLASVGLAAGLVAANFVLGVRDPNLPSQTIDAGFHYNAVLAVMHSGFPDGGHVGAASGAAATAWYPPLWHDLTALASSLTGVNVAIGANAVGWAIGGVVWPLSMVWLCSRILPHARLLTSAGAGPVLRGDHLVPVPHVELRRAVAERAVAGSPAGCDRPDVDGASPDAAIPQRPGRHQLRRVAADGATLDEVEAAAVQRGVAVGPGLSWWTVLSVGFLGCVGMFFAHPGAVFALGIWAFIGAVMLSARLVASSRALGTRQLRRSLLLLLLGWTAAAGLWAAMSLDPQLNQVRHFKWAALMTMNQAMGQALTLSTVITKAHWALGRRDVVGLLPSAQGSPAALVAGEPRLPDLPVHARRRFVDLGGLGS